jgi:hypothetical protein
MLHIFHHGLLPDSLLDPTLRLNIEWVCIQRLNLPLSLQLKIFLSIAKLGEELGEPRRVTNNGIGELRLCLGNGSGAASHNGQQQSLHYGSPP